jgi:hypothetical protein
MTRRLATFIVERSIINTVTGGLVLGARPSATQHPTPFAHGFLADASKWTTFAWCRIGTS